MTGRAVFDTIKLWLRDDEQVRRLQGLAAMRGAEINTDASIVRPCSISHQAVQSGSLLERMR